MIDGALSEGKEEDAEIVWPLPPEVDLSIRALGFYLCSAIYGWLLFDRSQPTPLAHLRFESGRLLRTQMLAVGWCPSDVDMVAEQFSPSSACYASLLERSNTLRNHSACSRLKCFALSVANESTYRTKHCEQTCRCPSIGLPIEDLVQRIKSGRTPLLTIVVEKESATPNLRVTASTARTEYICISHVWSDGLGNTNENNLPRCQILRLKKVFDETFDLTSALSYINRGRFSDLLRRYRNMSVPFWMDTLCIPVREKYQPIRSLAVTRIKDVFQSARQVLVLVLDAELQRVVVHDSCEIFIRINLAKWMRRLWTLPKGVLSSRVHVKLQNRVVDLDDCFTRLFPYRRVDDPINPDEVYGSVQEFASMFYWKMRFLRLTVTDAPNRRYFGSHRDVFEKDCAEKTAVIPHYEPQRRRLSLSREPAQVGSRRLVGHTGGTTNAHAA